MQEAWSWHGSCSLGWFGTAVVGIAARDKANHSWQELGSNEMRETVRTSGFMRHLHWMYIKSSGADCLLVVMSCSLMINTEISTSPWGHEFSVLTQKTAQ